MIELVLYFESFKRARKMAYKINNRRFFFAALLSIVRAFIFHSDGANGWRYQE